MRMEQLITKLELISKSSIRLLSSFVTNIHVLQLQSDQQYCNVDSDCGDLPYKVCGLTMPNVCEHKGIRPITLLEVFGLIIFAAFMALSNIAGIGGGGVAVPLLIGFFHLNTKPAIAISSFNIAITTATRFILNFHRKHPEKPNVAVVDYNIATIMRSGAA